MKRKTVRYEVTDYSNWELSDIMSRMGRLVELSNYPVGTKPLERLSTQLSTCMEIMEIKREMGVRMNLKDDEFDRLLFGANQEN